MKSFTTLVFAASLALTSAQATYNATTGLFTCATANAAYCAGDSLSTNIIIRCNGFVGQPGNCNDNLDGEFPFGLNFAPCYQTSPTSGQAACSKNCIVYGGSGTINGTFALPGCVPSATPSTSATAFSTASTSSSATSVSISLTTVTYSYTTVTVPCNSTTSASPPPPLTTGPASQSSGGAPTPISNSTVTASSGSNGGSGGNGGSTGSGGNGGSGGSATATPVGPTATPTSPSTTGPAPFTGAATANQAGAFLLVAAFFAAALL